MGVRSLRKRVVTLIKKLVTSDFNGGKMSEPKQQSHFIGLWEYVIPIKN